MQGQRIGSVRASTVDQHPERQLEQVQVDRMETDTASGRDTKRAALAAMLTFVREGDTVVVHSRVQRCRIVTDRMRLWKQGVRDLVMALCCALHHVRVHLTPWQPLVSSG
jgi:DNA invertase Pin-like site-specific DNA recombinase